MTTLGDVITDVQRRLRSYTGQHERSTHLAASATDSVLALDVADGDVVETGLVQIDDELIYVTASQSGTLTVAPYGRGYAGSTAAAHDENAQVVVDPFFPRVDITQAINDAALAAYPRLFQVKTETLSYTSTVATYDLAADVDRVLDVRYEAAGSTGRFPRVSRWTADLNADSAVYASGKTITFGETLETGNDVRVTYAARFGTLADAATTFASVGLEDSYRDVLMLGAAYRLVQFLEPARLNLGSIENQERAQYAAAGSASALTRQLLGLYEQRISEEQKLLRDKWPPRPHRISR